VNRFDEIITLEAVDSGLLCYHSLLIPSVRKHYCALGGGLWLEFGIVKTSFQDDRFLKFDFISLFEISRQNKLIGPLNFVHSVLIYFRHSTVTYCTTLMVAC